ncbi:hypothetical protein ANCDUO_02225 [Ancylostoma duodenale]|uniref:Uncharacterized protein n=1 Tax=Ancylostoma duodenale TaxID=51022 RepID=A0A0C2H117_9BILA|nr:hypothetical protein ANCDUO_02225 [Ancylostoma duodenale]
MLRPLDGEGARAATSAVPNVSFRYVYVKTWVLKPFSEWCRPAIKLTTWECIEIFLDTYSTYKFLRGFVLMLEGHSVSTFYSGVFSLQLIAGWPTILP